MLGSKTYLYKDEHHGHFYQYTNYSCKSGARFDAKKHYRNGDCYLKVIAGPDLCSRRRILVWEADSFGNTIADAEYKEYLNQQR